jgi:hypothetical protein
MCKITSLGVLGQAHDELFPEYERSGVWPAAERLESTEGDFMSNDQDKLATGPWPKRLT